MGRAKIDYAKLYREIKQAYEELLGRNDALVKSHKHLTAEFDKAVVECKHFREMLYEQRGVIGYLESKIEKLEDGSEL
jgi:predicted nuclease with TOPRIM domain